MDHGLLQEYTACGWNMIDPLQHLAKFYYHDYVYSEEDGTSSLYALKSEFAADPPFLVTGDFKTIILDYAEEHRLQPVFNRRVSKVKYDVQTGGDTPALVCSLIRMSAI